MMNTATPSTTKNLDGYGAPTIDWDRVQDCIDKGFTQAPDEGGPNRHTTWLATVNPDGRPHVVPIGASIVDGSFFFTSGDGTRKSKNIAADPRCSVTVATHDFDLVAEGEAVKVTDPETLERIARVYTDQGWPASVAGDALTAEFSAPSAGPPPWYVYKVTPTTVFALGTSEPYGATRFDF